MEVIRALELALALIALVTLPCAVAAVICADEAIDAFRTAVRRRRERWSEQWVLGRLERSSGQSLQILQPMSRLFALAATGPPTADGTAPGGWHAIPTDVVSPPFEQVAEEIRQLHVERLGVRGEERRAAVDEAYGGRLKEACRALGITEHLAELEDIDHEIEIIRIEGELIAAGMRIR